MLSLFASLFLFVTAPAAANVTNVSSVLAAAGVSVPANIDLGIGPYARQSNASCSACFYPVVQTIACAVCLLPAYTSYYTVYVATPVPTPYTLSAVVTAREEACARVQTLAKQYGNCSSSTSVAAQTITVLVIPVGVLQAVATPTTAGVASVAPHKASQIPAAVDASSSPDTSPDSVSLLAEQHLPASTAQTASVLTTFLPCTQCAPVSVTALSQKVTSTSVKAVSTSSMVSRPGIYTVGAQVYNITRPLVLAYVEYITVEYVCLAKECVFGIGAEQNVAVMEYANGKQITQYRISILTYVTYITQYFAQPTVWVNASLGISIHVSVAPTTVTVPVTTTTTITSSMFSSFSTTSSSTPRPSSLTNFSLRASGLTGGLVAIRTSDNALVGTLLDTQVGSAYRKAIFSIKSGALYVNGVTQTILLSASSLLSISTASRKRQVGLTFAADGDLLQVAQGTIDLTFFLCDAPTPGAPKPIAAGRMSREGCIASSLRLVGVVNPPSAPFSNTTSVS